MTNNTIDNKIVNDDFSIEKPRFCPTCSSSNTTNHILHDGVCVCLDCHNDKQQCDGLFTYTYDEEMVIVTEFIEMCDAIFKTSHNYVNPVLITELKLYRDKHKETLDQYFNSSYMWQMRAIYSVIYSASHKDMLDVKGNVLLDDVIKSLLDKISSAKCYSSIDPKIITEAKNIISKYDQYFECDLRQQFNATILGFVARRNAMNNNVIDMPYMNNSDCSVRYAKEDNVTVNEDENQGDFNVIEKRFHKRIFVMCSYNPIVIFLFYFLTLALIQITSFVIEITFYGKPFMNILDPIMFTVGLVSYLRTISSLADYLLGEGAYSGDYDGNQN